MERKTTENSRPGQLRHALEKAWGRKTSFLATFFVILMATTGSLSALDLLPETGSEGTAERLALSAAAPLAGVPEQYPTHIEIPEIGLEATVANPNSTNVATLDAALLKGAVRYPTSARLGEEGNVIIFGHSSYLPIVRNEAFKAFNGIQDLKKGDRIYVTGSSHTFVYEVKSVTEADAESAAIPLTASGNTLTLATCDSFGSKSDRFIVVADLVESYPVGN